MLPAATAGVTKCHPRGSSPWTIQALPLLCRRNPEACSAPRNHKTLSTCRTNHSESFFPPSRDRGPGTLRFTYSGVCKRDIANKPDLRGSSTKDLCGKWHPFVKRIARVGVADAMDFSDVARDGDGRIVGSKEKMQDPAQSKELNTVCSEKRCRRSAKK